MQKGFKLLRSDFPSREFELLLDFAKALVVQHAQDDLKYFRTTLIKYRNFMTMPLEYIIQIQSNRIAIRFRDAGKDGFKYDFVDYALIYEIYESVSTQKNGA